MGCIPTSSLGGVPGLKRPATRKAGNRESAFAALRRDKSGNGDEATMRDKDKAGE